MKILPASLYMNGWKLAHEVSCTIQFWRKEGVARDSRVYLPIAHQTSMTLGTSSNGGIHVPPSRIMGRSAQGFAQGPRCCPHDEWQILEKAGARGEARVNDVGRDVLGLGELAELEGEHKHQSL